MGYMKSWVGTGEEREGCVLCRDKCVSVSHTLWDCSAYRSIRAQFLLKLQASLGGVVSLGTHAHSEGTVVGSVCVSVCQSATLHLTSRVFVRLTKDTTYLTGKEGQKFLTVFSENAPLREKANMIMSTRLPRCYCSDI